MSHDSNHSEQLERYLSGQMSPEEAHAFEREALDDPFLSEALEGFDEQHPKQVKEDLADLRIKLEAKKSKTSWSFMKIAAAVALLIVAGFSAWFITSENTRAPNELAIQEQEKDGADPGTTESSNPVTPERNLKKEELQEKEPAQKTSEPSRSDEASLQPQAEPGRPNYSTAGTGDSAMDDAQLPEAEKESEPAPVQQKPVAAEPAHIEIPEGPEEEIAVALDVEITEETVVESLIFEEAPQEEIASESFAISSMKVKDVPLVTRLRGSFSFQSEAVPVDGWQPYNQYLSDSLRYPAQALRMGVTGRVFVQAIIDRSGTVDTAFVVEGIGAGCDEEAVRLVIEGPRFKSDTSSMSQIVIPVDFKIK